MSKVILLHIMKHRFCLILPRMLIRLTDYSNHSTRSVKDNFAQKIVISHLRLYSKMPSEKTSRISAYEGFHKIPNGTQTDIVVDLRSDTVTKPSKEMRQAMAEAAVGDDVYREDTTANEFEERVAKTLGKEAGLFVTSGTMGNLIAALVHCDTRGSEIIVGDQAHMFCYEQGNLSQFGGIHSNQIPNNSDGTFSIKGVIDRIRSDDIHYPITKLICVENTHNRCGGRVLPLEWLDELGEVSKKYRIPLHMDGARVFNASIALGQPVSRITKHFNSVSVCLSKGLGAPIGSVLVGDLQFIEKARRLRKALGGGMRQIGILAAAGMYCLDHMIERLQNDHKNAKLMAKIINEMNSPYVFIKTDELDTNIVMLHVKEFPITEFCERLRNLDGAEKNTMGTLVAIVCGPWSESMTRLVTHCDINVEMVVKAAEKICYVTKEFTRALSK